MKMIQVSTKDQTLAILDDSNHVLKRYPISTSRVGIGFEPGSHKTPLGNFIIDEKIGGDQPIYTIFSSRKPVGIWNQQDIDLGLITSRILWLSGVDDENKNTKERFVYIHGTSEEHMLGKPRSRGCVNMKNTDIVELYDMVSIGTPVVIREK